MVSNNDVDVIDACRSSGVHSTVFGRICCRPTCVNVGLRMYFCVMTVAFVISLLWSAVFFLCAFEGVIGAFHVVTNLFSKRQSYGSIGARHWNILSPVLTSIIVLLFCEALPERLEIRFGHSY